MGQKLKHTLVSVKILSNCLPRHTDSKMYSLAHRLVFKLHKVIGQRSFQICTGGSKYKIAQIFNEKIPQIVYTNT